MIFKHCRLGIRSSHLHSHLHHVRHWRKPGSCWETLGNQLPQHPPASSTRHGTVPRKMWCGWKEKTWKANNKKCHILSGFNDSPLMGILIEFFICDAMLGDCRNLWCKIWGQKELHNWTPKQWSCDAFQVASVLVTWVTWGKSTESQIHGRCGRYGEPYLAKRQEQFSNVMDASSKAVNYLGDDHKKVHGHGAKLCNVGMSRDLTTMKNCFFPTLKSIHLHGIQGILTHLAQAEKTKQPRPQMTCFVFCDGMKGLFPRRGSTQKPQLFFWQSGT